MAEKNNPPNRERRLRAELPKRQPVPSYAATPRNAAAERAALDTHFTPQKLEALEAEVHADLKKNRTGFISSLSYFFPQNHAGFSDTFKGYTYENGLLGISYARGVSPEKASDGFDGINCGNGPLVKNFRTLISVQAGLHEAVHVLDIGKGYSEKLVKAMVRGKNIEAPFDTSLVPTLRENMGDAASMKFLLHRYGDNPQVAEYARHWAAFRTAKQPFSHQTADGIDIILKDWEKTRAHDPNYSLSQATEDSYKILNANIATLGDGLVRKAKIEKFDLLRPLLADRHATGLDIENKLSGEKRRADDVACTPESLPGQGIPVAEAKTTQKPPRPQR